MPLAAGAAHHLTARHNLRVVQHGVHRLQIGVAVGAIHNRMKLSVQRHRCIRRAQAEVGCIRLAIHHNVVQLPLIMPFGRKHAADALDGSEISMRKAVIARDRRLPRIVRMKRPEITIRGNRAHRLGIDELRRKVPPLALFRRSHPDIRNHKHHRRLARLAAHDVQHRVIHLHAIHVDALLVRALLSAHGVQRLHLLTHLLRRNVQMQPAHLHQRNVHRAAKQIMPVSMKGELLHRRQRPP